MREKMIRRLAALFFILFFLLAYKCSAIDTLRSKTRVIYFPETVMKFNMGEGDTTRVTILADSARNYSYRILVYYPPSKCAEDYSLIIGFQDGSMEKYPIFYCSKYSNMCEYEVKNITRLRSMKFDYLAFARRWSEEACINIRTKDYFMKFLNELK